ncbi:MAG TPA: N-formylglutamate amidohydrolase [Sphingomonadaceae bacterium]|nr:N-formylglutamate amidohydrolase [Sphingomonadaceae bacterium]
MDESFVELEGKGSLLLIADHASNHVPGDIHLGVAPHLLHQHVAIDIGVDPLARALCARLGCPAILGDISRLVTDLNREEDAAGLVPVVSDGHDIPGNAALDEAGRAARIDRFWRPYHARVADRVRMLAPDMLISLHSFTPRLATSDVPRPWEVGILYNQDERAARVAIPLLEAAGVVTGDNQPYSGRLLNATMNRHGEANGIPYLGIEVRQDLIDTPAGVARWAEILAPVIAKTLTGLREAAQSAKDADGKRAR